MSMFATRRKIQEDNARRLAKAEVLKTAEKSKEDKPKEVKAVVQPKKETR